MRNPQSVSLFEGQLQANSDYCLGFTLLEDLDYLVIAQELYVFRDALGSRIENGILQDEDILRTFTSTNPSKLEFSTIPSTWTNLSRIDKHIEIQPAESRVLTALSLQAHMDMWTWFSWNVTEPVLLLLKTPIASHANEDVQSNIPNPWIYPLFQKVQLSLLLCKDLKLVATDFFEGVEAPIYTSTYGVEPRIMIHVESAVALWLKFLPRPGMSLATSRAVANFIRITSKVFGGVDFLYLSFIQERIKTLRASLTDKKIPLPSISWEELVEALEVHPLANPHSDESVSVSRLRDFLWAVSGLPNTFSPEMGEQYKIAVELGGVKGLAAFADFPTPPYPM